MGNSFAPLGFIVAAVWTLVAAWALALGWPLLDVLAIICPPVAVIRGGYPGLILLGVLISIIPVVLLALTDNRKPC